MSLHRVILLDLSLRRSTRDGPACVNFHAADDSQFRVLVFYGLCDSIDNR
jgi:hypothetical protein